MFAAVMLIYRMSQIPTETPSSGITPGEPMYDRHALRYDF
jgi:hypothetical protein